MKSKFVVGTFCCLLLSTGCASAGKWFPSFSSKSEDWNVKKVTSKWKVGPEFRENDDGTNENRWTGQTGIEAELYNGNKFGITYRRRDIDRAAGINEGHDNGVWLTASFPIWKDTSRTSKEMALERRIAKLEAQLAE